MKTIPRNIFQRLFGICVTRKPSDPGCWSYADGVVTVDLSRAPELKQPAGGLRIEGPSLQERVLVIRGEDNTWHAFRNRCEHAGRRLDPVPGDNSVQCCSVGKATYDYQGQVISGNVKGSLTTYPVEEHEGKLFVTLKGRQ